MDDECLRRCRKRLSELDAEYEQADRNNDEAEKARIESKKEQILEQINKATGLGGRPRPLGRNEGQRAADAVGKAIKRAYAHIENAGLSELVEWFKKSIRTGCNVVYDPPVTVPWVLH